MIPLDFITAWRSHAPWPQLSQVEQDLIICRALAELYSHPLLAENLAFRGGTALFKLHLPPARYRPCSRNPLIAQTLAILDKMEQRGSGFARTRDAMLDHGLDEPRLDQQDGFFVVTLR